MLRTYDGISDLNFSVGHPLQVEDYGELKPVYITPPIESLTPFQTEHLALTLMQGSRRLMRDFIQEGSCDCSYSLNQEARFRVNIFRQRGNFAIVMRKLQAIVPRFNRSRFRQSLRKLRKRKLVSCWSRAPPAAARPPPLLQF